MNINENLLRTQLLQLEVELDKLEITSQTDIDTNFGEFNGTISGELNGVSFVIYSDLTNPIIQISTGEDEVQTELSTTDPAQIISELIKIV